MARRSWQNSLGKWSFYVLPCKKKSILLDEQLINNKKIPTQNCNTNLCPSHIDFVECNGRNKICCDQIKRRKCLSWFSNNIEWELLIGGTKSRRKCLGLDKEAIHWNCSFLQAFFASNCKYLFSHFISCFLFVSS